MAYPPCLGRGRCRPSIRRWKGRLEPECAKAPTVAMVWREATTKEELASTLLTRLAESLGAETEAWLDVVERPLPETLRITPGRSDSAWTASQIEALGGRRMAWMNAHEAFTMPFPRGHAEGEGRALLSFLHQSGRITRQEAASMLPVEVLPMNDVEVVVDLCAAPGSKTTQLAEAHPWTTVIANEPVSGRVNTLVSNRGRVSLANVLVVQHDGRHFPRTPAPGVDAVIADLPCTGSATMRKNREVWWAWRPSAGRELHHLQVGIARRAASLVRPGGHVVISTCSLDPVENEAVVAEVLRQCDWMEAVPLPPDRLNGLRLREGLTAWTLLDDEGGALLPEHAEAHHLPPTEVALQDALRMTRRLHPEDNDTGGFYVALLRHRPEATPEGVARTLVPKRPDQTPYLRDLPGPSRHDVHAVEEATSEPLREKHQLSPSLAWWRRGKRLALSPESMRQRLWAPETPDGRGGRFPGGSFHPMRAIHVGLPTFAENRGMWRVRQEGLPVLNRHGSLDALAVDLPVVKRLLVGEALEVDDLPQSVEPGSTLLQVEHPSGGATIPVWVQAKVTLMLDDVERRMLALRLFDRSLLEEEE